MFSFQLPQEFLQPYRTKTVPWGYRDAGGNALGELTFLRTYSRLKEDGTKERWDEVCARVIDGMYSIQKDHCKTNRLPWNDRKAQASAQEAYDRLFHLKWTPPGRGLWMCGTPMVMQRRNSAALNNCAMVSTLDMDRLDPGYVFAWAMDALMLGVGVGFDTRGREKAFDIHQPLDETSTFQVPDSREGWADSLRLLINSYLKKDQKTQLFDTSLIRPAGAIIKGFGGTASGPGPLLLAHDRIRHVLGAAVGRTVDAVIITDLMNIIGACVVAGNVRRSAELAMGDADDDDFINLKNPDRFPERNSTDPAAPGWGWMSNNSVAATVGCDYQKFADRVTTNGEPGFIWLDITRQYGRLKDAPNGRDHRVAGFNPCTEQPLESFELCTLCEVHLNRASNLEDFLRTLKFAYLYGKTVTLLPTHWDRTNAVMQRNRRIGTSITGIAGFVDQRGLPVFRDWAEQGYQTVKRYDTIYSEWLGVRESIKTTTVKPSGSVSILSGATPGVHWTPGGHYFLRAIRFATDDPIVPLLREAGYVVEADRVSQNTVVAYFPVKSDHRRSEQQVSIFEKIHLAAEAQRHWSDNGVSVTVSFDPEREGVFVPTVLRMYEGQLKAVSFLPMGNAVYPQQPYTQISEADYASFVGALKKIDMRKLYKHGRSEQGDRYCTTDVCEVKL